MVDHEGHVKEILWHYNEKGEHEGELFATIEDYLPENAPERLLPHAAQPCDATACAALAGPAVSPLSALEAVLLAVLLGVLLAWLYSLLALRRRPRPPTPATVDDSDASAPLLLADFPRFAHAAGDGAHPVCSNSTSVTKVECFLRFAGLRYSKQAVSPDPASSPSEQPPILERGSVRVGNSSCILRHLMSTGAAPAALQHPERPRDRAAAVAVARMCDTDLASAISFYRWVDDEGWARCRAELMRPYRMFAPVRAVISRMVRKASYTRVTEQGIGRLSDADRLALVGEELAALAGLLGDQPFLFGTRPHAADASAFAALDQMLARALNPQLAALAEAHPNLVAYRDRIRATYFGASYREEVAWVGGDGSAVPAAPAPAAPEEGKRGGARGPAQGKEE